ncbi:MAG: hypothetical protein H8M99_02805 [Gloeobacteraceae cyanobacterium ES-bin-144]|nr:hypothetical protein [Verrucomicrobiales bacterium]
MKRAAMLLLISLLAGLSAFCWMRSQKMASQNTVLLDSTPELNWMKSELKLSDAQFAKVSVLHTAYRPKCAEMCGLISQAHAKVEKLIHQKPEMTLELEQAIHNHAVIRAECQQAMLRHIFQTARVMNPDQAALYIEEIMPFALDFSHTKPQASHDH